MRILGIDPGMAAMGYGLVDYDNDRLTAIDCGVLTTSAGVGVGERLQTLYCGLIAIIERYQPSEFAIELFVARNLRTALAVGQARGVALLAAAQKKLPIYEYTPLQVKSSVAGYGRSGKQQVQEMVRIQLNLPSVPQPDDAADALAVAICHVYNTRLSKLISETP